MKRRYPHKSNVLLVNITRLGDMLQATPTIAGLKMENPNCRVTVLVEKQFEEVCKIIPNIDEVIGLDLGMTVRSLSREGEGIIDAFEYVSETIDDLKRRNFDYCLNMSSSAYTALLLRLLDIPAKGGWSSDEEGYRVIESDWARLFATSVFHQNRQFNSLNLVDVFRCSADVEQHPHKLLINVADKDREYARSLIAQAGFTNSGPLIAVQAGASQGKRQWVTANFVELINHLLRDLNARVVLTGTSKELSIINPIVSGVNSPNIFVAAGKTNIPQLTALLAESKVLITGDTGPMHISIAAGTPVISLFLASAYGYETGPYAEGNIVLQPVIACGPCNPNKPCARPDCHETIPPSLVARLAALRINGDIHSLPADIADPRQVTIYRSFFDEHGFYDLKPLNPTPLDTWRPYRLAYRKLWLDDLAGFSSGGPDGVRPGSSLRAVNEIEGLQEVVQCAHSGAATIERLIRAITDTRTPALELSKLNTELVFLDRRIEEIGFHNPPLGPLTRMFVFAKENLSGTEATDLASQMRGVYESLARRGEKLSGYMHNV